MKRIALFAFALMVFAVWAEPAEAQFRGLRGRGIGLNRGLRGRGFGGLGLLGLLGQGGYGQPIIQQQLIPVPYGVQQQAFAAPSCIQQQQLLMEQLYAQPQVFQSFAPAYGVGGIGGSLFELNIGRFGRGGFGRGPVRGRIR